MSGQIIEIPQTKGKASIWEQRLKVAASCRISTDHEDRTQSLENQVALYTRLPDRKADLKSRRPGHVLHRGCP